jgi:hypothetical protein
MRRRSRWRWKRRKLKRAGKCKEGEDFEPQRMLVHDGIDDNEINAPTRSVNTEGGGSDTKDRITMGKGGGGDLGGPQPLADQG